jgi:serine/threonine protein kinase
MSKAYSNKALPAGTVLREWRLEDVLGVGGFGIVYKAKGIYFGELVAIKEYFPSSISERDAEATVVPIDSDAEEVHALGLKKFVEEAKLLWNLSTPTRHPNIVSVRSLFEIHGTAYIVMDFEDGTSLSKMLKQGRRFNEAALTGIIRPVAEGLDRAHRVGVLHRDIKPPNILVNENGRPVLIDFGSARFETGEATSTKVTFHTPPYAALEQYVKTYKQGPWTDIYALGVVAYECITGEKPPEVLERLHGEMGEPLVNGRWPGFSKEFLAAVDAAMAVRPDDRPQTISEWLAMFPESSARASDEADEATRFFAHEVGADEIIPVAPPEGDFEPAELADSRIPADTNEVQFKRAGEETGTGKKLKKEPAPAKGKKKAPEPRVDEIVPVEPPKKPPKAADKAPSAPPSKMPKPALIAGGAAALLVAAIGGWAMFGRGGEPAKAPTNAATTAYVPQQVTNLEVAELASAATTLANDARTAGAPATAISDLVAAGDKLNAQSAQYQRLSANPAQAAAAKAQAEEMKRTATSANIAFANALLQDAEARANRVKADVRWSMGAGARTPEQRSVATRLSGSLADLRSAVSTAGQATDPVQSLNAARNALASSQAFVSVIPSAYRVEAALRRTPEAQLPKPPKEVVATTTKTPTVKTPTTTTKTVPEVVSTGGGVSPAKLSQFNAIVADGRGMARQVMRNPNAGANAKLAKNYDSYLAQLQSSMRGVKSNQEADNLIASAKRTRAYLSFLVKQSGG